MLRIAHVMAGAPEGGAELFFERLVAAQHRAGDAVLPIVRRNAPRRERLRASGLAPVELGFGGALDLLTRWRLRRVLRRAALPVVMAWMGRAAAATPRGPHVLVGRLGGYYDLRRFRHCDHLAGNTRAIVRGLIDQGWPADRAHLLPNFSPDLAGGVPAALPPGRIVLALGRLHRNKAFDVLLHAMPSLPGARLVIAGDGPERAALTRLAHELGVAERTHLLGWRDDTAALLAAADVLAVPSRQEPLGNTVLEAFSAARPVVAADADGPAELIMPEVDGLLVPREQPAALAAALGRVLADPALAARLAHAGRTRWAAEFAEASVLARWRATLTTLAHV